MVPNRPSTATGSDAPITTPPWLTGPAELDSWIDDGGTRLAVDTEFVRERTYWPQLALIQMALILPYSSRSIFGAAPFKSILL